MGTSPSLCYPQQSTLVGCRVGFILREGDPSVEHSGVILRKDMDPPYVAIIEGITGEFVLGSECRTIAYYNRST